MIGTLKIKDQFFILKDFTNKDLAFKQFTISIANEKQTELITDHFHEVHIRGRHKYEYSFSAIALIFESNKYMIFHGCFVVNYETSRPDAIFSYDKAEEFNFLNLFKEDELILIESLKGINKFNL